MASLARTAMVLLGFFWILRGLSNFAESVTGFLRYQRFDGNPDWLADWLVAAALAGGVALLVSLLPALLLVVFSRRIAERVFSDPLVSPAVTPTSAYVLGCALLALFFLVQGAGSLIAGLVAGVVVGSPMSHVAARGIVELAGGLLLYRHASSQRHPRDAG